jgi:Zn-dependent protease with chaperone function
MNFFENQKKARRNTILLVFLYLLAVVLIVISVYAGILIVLIQGDPELVKFDINTFWRSELFLSTIGIVLIIISFGTITKIFQLRSGGVAVATSLGGRLINPDTTDLKEKKVLNIVEEMAIAAGIFVPSVYLLPEEKSINAFAAGYNPNHAVIGVSQGSLDYLSRDELQGVIAHEFSHILNGDMRLNIRLIGILNGILSLATVGRVLLNSTSRSRRVRRNKDSKDGSGFIVAVGLVFLVVGGIGVFFGNLIKMAVSRQREFLADASAVQFTRNPDGIGGALKKIGGLVYGSTLQSPNADEASHMCFSNAISSWFGNLQLFSTHPPLKVRIKKIDPSFDGNFPEIKDEAPVDSNNKTQKQNIKNKNPFSLPGIDIPVGIPTAQLISNSVGTIEKENIANAKEIINNIPQIINSATKDPLDACALMCLLLLPHDEPQRSKQKNYIKSKLPYLISEALESLSNKILSIPTQDRLPILELAVNQIKQLTNSQYLQLRNAISELIHYDQHVSIFEYALFQLVTRYGDEAFQLVNFDRSLHKNLKKIVAPASKMLFALAHLTNKNADIAQKAYSIACDHCGIDQSLRFPVNHRENVNIEFLDQALDPIKYLAPEPRQKIFEACIVCIKTDNQVNQDEMELIRAISIALECPLPR